MDWTLSCLFDAMGAMSSKYNDDAKRLARFDANRDGFVIAAAADVWCWRSWSTPKRAVPRSTREVTGYGATSDGTDMVAPSAKAANASMKLAMATLGDRKVDYINAHGTSTPAAM